MRNLKRDQVDDRAYLYLRKWLCDLEFEQMPIAYKSIGTLLKSKGYSKADYILYRMNELESMTKRQKKESKYLVGLSVMCEYIINNFPWVEIMAQDSTVLKKFDLAVKIRSICKDEIK